MSNLTIGKIVNNSATLILNSTDQDGFGEKIVTGDSFTKGDATTIVAGQYEVIADNFKTLAGYYSETFSNIRYGPIAARTDITALEVDKFYAIKNKGSGSGGKFFFSSSYFSSSASLIFGASFAVSDVDNVSLLIFLLLRF